MIRIWTLPDLKAIQDIAWKTWAHAYKNFVAETDRRLFHQNYYNLQNLEMLYHNPDMHGYLAFDDDKAIGFTKTHMNYIEGRFYITSLYILPEYQGKGFGYDLFKADIEYALKLKQSQVWLGVLTQNLPSIKWYKRQEFKFVEEKVFAIGNTPLNHLIGYKLI